MWYNKIISFDTGRSIMRREDWSVPALLAEAVCILLEMIYIGLQFYYGFTYHVVPYKFILNIAATVLVYAALTLLAIYPERINRMPEKMCVGRVRTLSIRMVRMVKYVFVAGLMVPCVCDVAGIQIQEAYCIIVMGLMLITAVYYEVRIIQEVRNQKK